jgi:hypothetical protein
MSYTTDKPKFENNKIHLPKIGWIKFKCKLSTNDLSNITVSCKNERYYASITYKNVTIVSAKYVTDEIIILYNNKILSLIKNLSLIKI